VALVFLLYRPPVNPWQFPRWVNLLAFALPGLLAALAFHRWPTRRVLGVLAAGCLLEMGSDAWADKEIYSMRNVSGIDPAHPGQHLLVEHLEKHFPARPGQPPPRVLINSHAVPENYGMIHGYSSPDAYTSLFLKRPWDYLHAMAGIASPSLANTYLSYDIYRTDPFPWPAIAQDVGFHTNRGLINNPRPTPRAYLSYAAVEHANPITLLTNGHDIYRASIVESPVDLPAEGPPAEAAVIERFEDNEIRLRVEAGQKALLVLAEAWYPGWRAEVKGESIKAVPANLWMRAFPVPPGEYPVRVYYRERKLPAGLALSVPALIAALIAARRRSARSESSAV